MRKKTEQSNFWKHPTFDAKNLPEFLFSSQAVIAAATEVLYTQSTQLFPGPDDTVTHQVKLAIDQEAEIVYWLVPQPATGYISLVYLGLNRETPMKGHDNSIVFAGVFDGLLRPTQLGMPKICFFF